MNNRLQREKAFHDRRFGGEDAARRGVLKIYSINTPVLESYKLTVQKFCRNADLLELGCGAGSLSFFWAAQGARVTGIDISDEGVNKARALARARDLDIAFYPMNAEAMAFDDNSFDGVAGNAIIHHLELERIYAEIARVLRPGGRAVFVEPLGHNPALNLYRRLTPAQRTPDEHPLLMRDIELAGRYFEQVTTTYFHIFTLLAVPFRKFGFFDSLVTALHAVDRRLMAATPFLRCYAWIAIIELENPKTSPAAAAP